MYGLRILVLVLFGVSASSAFAFLEPFLDNGEWDGETGFELRYFDDPGEFGQEQVGTSLRLQGEYHTEWNDESDTFTFLPHLRLDQQDEERTHADIREALWIHVGDSWELRTGITRVFWGRTEFNHLVDTVNQLDLVDGDEEKLGQPMINLSLVHDLGIFDFYFLMGFRERTYPGEDGRLRSPLVVDTDNAQYLGSASKSSMDFAFRWQTTVTDELEMALSLFSGVDREPTFSFNFDFADPMLVPYYSKKTQLGIELEYINEGWAVKFEGIDVTNQLQDYNAAVLGVEYSFYSLFESDIDMTFITEYMWDSRDATSPGFLEHDFGFATRFSFNDEFDTTFLAGLLWDPETDEKLATFEGERRIFSDFKVKLLARIMMERGQPELNDTTVSILSALASSGLLSNDLIDQEFIVDYLYELIRDNGLEILFQNQQFVPALQQLQRLADANRKLSILESDDYVQLELIYYY